MDKKPGPAPPGWQHFDVELDQQKMVCRHKTGDNPFITAQRFLDENLLDQSLLDQVCIVGTALISARARATAHGRRHTMSWCSCMRWSCWLRVVTSCRWLFVSSLLVVS